MLRRVASFGASREKLGSTSAEGLLSWSRVRPTSFGTQQDDRAMTLRQFLKGSCSKMHCFRVPIAVD